VAASLRLIVGLGNPGTGEARTRHNAGFWFVDALASQHGAAFRQTPRFFGDTCELSCGTERVRLLKPSTYMNLSGRAVGALANFYRISPEEILVAHDEIDLPAGVARLKVGGGHGGHNGLRDIHRVLAKPDYLRLRIGVGHPGHKDAVHDYVLSKPSDEQRKLIEQAIDDALAVVPEVVAGRVSKAMNALNRQDKGEANPGSPPPARGDS
jgi:PTH1 family peptidyl-tRNA hydrolase